MYIYLYVLYTSISSFVGFSSMEAASLATPISSPQPK